MHASVCASLEWYGLSKYCLYYRTSASVLLLYYSTSEWALVVLVFRLKTISYLLNLSCIYVFLCEAPVTRVNYCLYGIYWSYTKIIWYILKLNRIHNSYCIYYNPWFCYIIFIVQKIWGYTLLCSEKQISKLMWIYYTWCWSSGALVCSSHC